MHARDAYANVAYIRIRLYALYAVYALYVVGSCPRYTARLKCYVDVVSGYGWIRRGHEYYNSVTMTVRNIPVRWSLVTPSPSDRTWNTKFFFHKNRDSTASRTHEPFCGFTWRKFRRFTSALQFLPPSRFYVEISRRLTRDSLACEDASGLRVR